MVDYKKDFDHSIESVGSSYNKINSFITKYGFNPSSIEDYIRGVVYKKDDKNVYKIGKILTKLEDKQPEVMNSKDVMVPEYTARFKNDPIRHIKNPDLVIVISRHPYDIYGMSTDRMWTSCMNMNKNVSGELGNTSYIPKEIEKGTLIAYLTPKSEMNSVGKISLKKPVSRVLLKPMNNEDGELGYAISKSYGGHVDGFMDFVKNWIFNNFNKNVKDKSGFSLACGVYEDPYEPIDLEDASPEVKRIRELTAKVENIKNEFVSHLTNRIKPNITINSFIDEDDLLINMTVSFNFKIPKGGSPYRISPTDLANRDSMMKQYNVHWKVPSSEYFKGVSVNPTLGNLKFIFKIDGSEDDINKMLFWILKIPAQTLGQ